MNKTTTDKRSNTIHFLLMLALFGFISIVGGGFYEILNIYPSLWDGPPRSMYVFQGEHGIRLHIFWIPAHFLSEITLIILLILCWKKDKVLKSFLLKAFVLHMAMRVSTFLYFAPTIMKITAVPSADLVDPALDQELTTWMGLSIVRVPLSIVVAWFILKGYSYFIKSSSPAQAD